MAWALLVTIISVMLTVGLTSYFSGFLRMGQEVAPQHLAYLEDEERKLDALAVQTRPFVRVDQQPLVLGASRSAHWLRIDVRAFEAASPLRYLALANPEATELTLYVPSPRVRFSDHLAVQELGTRTPFAYRPTSHPLSVFDLEELSRSRPNPYVYLRVMSHHPVRLVPRLYTEEALQRQVLYTQLRVGFVSGSFFIMMLSCLVMYRLSGAGAFFWLAMGAPFLLATELAGKEYAFIFVLSHWPDWAPAATTLFEACFLACYAMVVAHSLSLAQAAPRWHRVCLALGGAAVVVAMASLTGPSALPWTIPLLQILHVVGSVVFMACALLACHKGVTGAVSYCALQGVFGIVIVWWQLETYVPQDLTRSSGPALASDLFTVGCLAVFALAPHTMLQHLARQQAALWRVRRNALQAMETQVLSRIVDLERAKRRSERLAHEQGKVLTTMTHELRSPLSAVIGMSRLLRDDPRFVPALRADLATVTRLSCLLLSIVDEGLSYLRGEQQLSGSDDAAVDMRAFRHDMRGLCTWMSGSHHARFDLSWDTTLPDWLVIDVGALTQICINLITNAGRYCDHGEVHLAFVYQPAAATGKHSAGLLLTVSDTGHGIPPSKLAGIFEPHRYSPHRVGLGVGLSIVREHVVRCGGTIEVVSVLNEGTRFTVRIPAEDASSIVTAATEVAGQSSSATPDFALPNGPTDNAELAIESSSMASFGAARQAKSQPTGTAASEPAPESPRERSSPGNSGLGIRAPQVARALALLPALAQLHRRATEGAYTEVEQWLATAQEQLPAEEGDTLAVLKVLEAQLQQLDYASLESTVALGTEAGV